MTGEAQGRHGKEGADIERLKAQLENADIAKQLALKEALGEVEKERDSLKRDLEAKDAEQKLLETSLKERYETQIKDRDDAIERLKDMKAKLSTKMVGETLEQHCEIEFNKIRLPAFPHAYFEKDNDARTGSKGDYIFRDFDESGTEFISIMFEMKNESDTTATKKKNEDFFRELDKDRTEKNCEYAILVSLLEPDNGLQLGNRGRLASVSEDVRDPASVLPFDNHDPARCCSQFPLLQGRTGKGSRTEPGHHEF